MFESVATAKPDAILGLSEAFKKDTNPAKINLTVGVFVDASGITPLLPSVREAEQRILAAQTTKTYVSPLNGTAQYVSCVQEMLFGAGHELSGSGRVITAHTPGGTGALRLAGDYLKVNHPGLTLWLSNPTWANHGAVFEAAGVPTNKYAYFDAATNELAFERMMESLRGVPAGDVVLLHACCHNPTGVDPTQDQWRQIAELLSQRGILPLIDFAYQGFGDGLEEDAAGLRALCAQVPELMVCSSFSKNFSVYNERVGALTMVAATEAAAAAVLSQVKVCIRRNYSNPPGHGAQIVATIIQDASLRAQWQQELQQMRDRIQSMRRLFAEGLSARGVRPGGSDSAFMLEQRGMFSFSGLTAPQVQRLREEHAIYMLASGRINVAAMTEATMDTLCDAIAAVSER